MKFIKSTLPLALAGSLLVSTHASANETFNNFIYGSYSQGDAGYLDTRAFDLYFAHYFDGKTTYGVLGEFEYINRSSFVNAGFARETAKVDVFGNSIDSTSDIKAIDGGAFISNFFVGASIIQSSVDTDFGFGETSADQDAEVLTLGYLATDELYIAVSRTFFEFDDLTTILGQYEVQLSGDGYLGFSLEINDIGDDTTKALSTRWFNDLNNGQYFALEASYTDFEDFDDYWALAAKYYFTRQTSARISYDEEEAKSIGLEHFFTTNLSIDFSYTESDFVALFSEEKQKSYTLAMRYQF